MLDQDWRLQAKCAELADDFYDPDIADPVERSIWYLFFEGYEQRPELRSTANQICAACPVRQECLNNALENNETGMYGGVYLNRGHIDEVKNAEKTTQEWEAIRRLVDVS